MPVIISINGIGIKYDGTAGLNIVFKVGRSVCNFHAFDYSGHLYSG